MFMKSELDLLIEHLQKEVDYLKSAMEESVEEWDFKAAEHYRSLEITITRFIDKPVYQALQQIAQLFYEGLELSGDKTIQVSVSY